MSANTKYIIVSLPTSITSSNDPEEALNSLRSTVSSDGTSLTPLNIPNFKIGTLDALVQQADDLAKLETACSNTISKIGDSLKSLLDGNEEKISQQKTVNDKPVDHYLRTFNWNKVKYRADKPIGDGNLSTKSLTPVVDPSTLVRDSEYLETVLIVVPTNVKKEFMRSYETISPMVVPRSSVEIAEDKEGFTLFAVTVFRKHVQEFLHKCREMKWTPRDYKYVEGGQEEERKELERVGRDERKTTPKLAKKTKTLLDSAYSYLGGNAFGRDKNGRVAKDDSAMSSEMAAAGVAEGYTAYVYFEFEII
ncbi:hypothetical protein B7463_g6328, partial [Scytalidium lignicola]